MPKLNTLVFLENTKKFNVPKTYQVQNLSNPVILSQLGLILPIIMRSSFAIEDWKDHAFAGMFNSYFPIFTEIDYNNWLQVCQEIPERATLYAEKIWYHQKIITPDIFLQEFIIGDFSGVIFTTYNTSVIRIEIVPWILAPLVQWDIAFPLIIEINKKQMWIMKIVKPYLHSSYFTIEDKNVVEKPFSWIGFEVRIRNIMVDILDVVNKIESIFWVPQDIEFTVRNNDIYILQSRPIST